MLMLIKENEMVDDDDDDDAEDADADGDVVLIRHLCITSSGLRFGLPVGNPRETSRICRV